MSADQLASVNTGDFIYTLLLEWPCAKCSFLKLIHERFKSTMEFIVMEPYRALCCTAVYETGLDLIVVQNYLDIYRISSYL